jgi:hypothetical protein
MTVAAFVNHGPFGMKRSFCPNGPWYQRRVIVAVTRSWSQS